MTVHNKKKKKNAISGCVNIGYIEYLYCSKLTIYFPPHAVLPVFTPCVGGAVRVLAQLGPGSTRNMSMFSTGILVLTSPLHTLQWRIAPVLSSAAQLVERTLYVHLHPGLNLGAGAQPRPVFIPPVVDLSAFISRVYSNAADVCGHLDVRVLLTNVCAQSSAQTSANCPFPTPQCLSHSPEVVLTDFPLQDPGQSHQVTQCLQKYTGHCYVCSPSLSSVLLHPQLVKCLGEEEALEAAETKTELLNTYSDVVVGGTFDRLHGAHKTLLNISCLLANRRFLIGVCDEVMLKSEYFFVVLVLCCL